MITKRVVMALWDEAIKSKSIEAWTAVLKALRLYRDQEERAKKARMN